MPTTVKVILLFIPVLLAACKGAGPAAFSCPPGTQAMGELPPGGQERWCQKMVNGEAVKEGPFEIYRGEGTLMMKGEYHDGKQSGEWTMWYDNGQKASIDHYKDGVQDGAHIGWYSNGKISAMGQYKDGKREGVWKRWDAQGFRNWEETYKDDKQVSG
jgi:antitoxin component YwqK of YwqJK toxin-antitoxin module